MILPSTSEINHALKQIESSELSEDHPRQLARKAITEFRLDREKGDKPLPVSNVHDDRGAKVLDVDEVLRRSEPNHVRDK